MLQEVIPFVSCICNETRFQEAIQAGYSEIYVALQNGKFMKHQKLSNGRHVRLNINSLPKHVAAKNPAQEVVVSEEINFLPAGKIPYVMLQQIVKFFKQVMEVKKCDYEAHCFILWNKDDGYFISVPKQTVSKASVSFTYDNDAIPPGSVIVLDIHSHNTMGAFYSGTDDNNDKNGIYYSAVVGRLDQKTPEMVLRFNLLEEKRKCDFSEIFDIPEETVAIDPKWLDQVEVKVQSLPKTQPGYGRVGRTFPGTHQAQSHNRGRNQNSQNTLRSSDLSEDDLNRIWNQYGLDFSAGGPVVYEDDASDEFVQNEAGEMVRGFRLNEETEEQDPVGGNGLAQYQDQKQRGVGSIASGEYDYMVAQYGEKVADAKETIEAFLDELDQNDELLLDVIRQCYELMTESGQARLATQGI